VATADMDWLPLAGGLGLLVLDADFVLAEDPDELPTLIRTLADASVTYSTPIERGRSRPTRVRALTRRSADMARVR